MSEVLERIILETASEENLTLDEFVEAFKSAPDDWYAFRSVELVKFVNLVLIEAAGVAGSEDPATLAEQLQAHFGLKNTENS